MRMFRSNAASIAAHADSQDRLPEESEQTSLASIIIRIDQPAIVSTRTVPVVSLRGWIFVPPDVEPILADPGGNPVILEAYVESAEPAAGQNPLLAGVRLSGAAISSVITPGNRFTRNLRLGRAAVDYYDEVSGIRGCRLEFDGEVDFSSALPKRYSAEVESAGIGGNLPNENRSYRLLVGCRIADRYACSNPVTLCFVDPEFYSVPAGGFIHIEPPRLNAPFLQVRGWAVAAGDPVVSAQIVVNGAEVRAAAVGIQSPEQAQILPDCSGSEACIFEGIVTGSELKAKGVDLSPQAPALLVSAVIRFQTGRELRFESYLVHFSSVEFADRNPAAPGVNGRIEKVEVTESGQLKIEGWILNRRYSRIQFRFSTLRGVIPLDEDQRGIVKRIERPDIDAANPLSTDGRSGFQITVTPQIFGRLIGLVRLEAVDLETGSVSQIGPEWAADGITAEIAPFRSGLQFRIEDTASQAVSRLVRHFRLDRAGRQEKRSAAERSLVVVPAPRKNRTVLFALHNLSEVEGAPKVMVEAIRSVIQQGSGKTSVVVVAGKDGSFRKKLEGLGAQVIVAPKLDWGLQTWSRYSAGLSAAARMFEQTAPDVVVAGVSDAFWAIDLAQRRGIKSLWCIQEGAHPYSKYPDFDPKLRKRYLAALQSADRMVFVAQSTRELYREVVSDCRATIIPNGIDLEAIDAERAAISRSEARRRIGSADSDLVVTIVGTTTFRKGQDIFLRESSRLKAEITRLRNEFGFRRDIRFYIVGARPSDYLFQLQALSQQLGLVENVTFVPEKSGIGEYFIASDLAVICSREEAAPLVSLEALAYGVPLLTTAVQGLAEQITDGVNGIIFESGTEGDMAGKALEILSRPDLRDRLVAGGRETVKSRFLLQSNIVRYSEEIESVVESGSK